MMAWRDWRLKAAIQGVLAVLPASERLNLPLQRLMGSLPQPRWRFEESVAVCRDHLEAVEPRLDRPISAARFFEFGAGWDLHDALVRRSMGVQRQQMVDLHRLARPDLVNHVIHQVEAHFAESLPRVGDDLDHDLLTKFGITYSAPCDARATGLPEHSIDVILSTSVLEHIPPHDLPLILAECSRLIAPGGVVSFVIDYNDHFASFDRRLSPYNFLRYNERAWRWLNPSLHYQSRLRHDDFLVAFDRAGFEVLEDRAIAPTAEDLASLRALPLNERWAGLPEDRVAIRGAHVVMRRP